MAFGCADLPTRLGLQHLLLGSNAHINLDLAVAAAQHSPGDAIAGLQEDFFRINQILQALLDPAQQVMAEFSLLRVLDVIGARSDEAVLDFSIQHARDDAWRHAVVLAQQQQALKDDTIAVLDRKTAFLGRPVRDPGGLAGRAVELISATSPTTLSPSSTRSTGSPRRPDHGRPGRTAGPPPRRGGAGDHCEGQIRRREPHRPAGPSGPGSTRS